MTATRWLAAIAVIVLGAASVAARAPSLSPPDLWLDENGAIRVAGSAKWDEFEPYFEWEGRQTTLATEQHADVSSPEYIDVATVRQSAPAWTSAVNFTSNLH